MAKPDWILARIIYNTYGTVEQSIPVIFLIFKIMQITKIDKENENKSHIPGHSEITTQCFSDNFSWKQTHTPIYIFIYMGSYLYECPVAQLWPTLCNPIDSSPPGPSVHRIFKTRSGLPFPTPGNLTDPGIEPMSLALAGRFFSTMPSGKSFILVYCYINWTFFFYTA